MNLKKLSLKELQTLINTTSDLALLERAEQEYIDRTCRPIDEEIE